jgi:hypothetical protein
MKTSPMSWREGGEHGEREWMRKGEMKGKIRIMVGSEIRGEQRKRMGKQENG